MCGVFKRAHMLCVLMWRGGCVHGFCVCSGVFRRACVRGVHGVCVCACGRCVVVCVEGACVAAETERETTKQETEREERTNGGMEVSET